VPLPAGATPSYAPLVLEPSGSVVLAARTAGGATVFRSEGEGWVAVGTELKANDPSCLVRAPNGDLWLSDSKGALYHWNGTAWTTPGGKPEGLFAKQLATAPDNSVFVAFGNDNREVLVHLTPEGVRYLDGKKDGRAAAAWEQIGAMVCDADGTVHVVSGATRPVPYAADRFQSVAAEVPAFGWSKPRTAPAQPVPTEYPALDEQAIAVSERYTQLYREITARQIELRGWLERCMVPGGPSRAMNFEYGRYLDTDFQPDLERMRKEMDAFGMGPMRNRLVDRFHEMLDYTSGLGYWLGRSIELNGSDDPAAMKEAADNMAASNDRLTALQAGEEAFLRAYIARNAGAGK